MIRAVLLALSLAALTLTGPAALAQEPASEGTAALLRGLDKHAGTVVDLPLRVGETIALGWLQITLAECRFPTANPSGDAYARLVIRESHGAPAIFDGWMIASSPALNALDHGRYDVWVMTCTTD
ncbi:MAG: hypothetical protein CSA73_00875 [Rhodobacterales bacterium]|nr:MAG: hypothetical protein CSA73_00875 [Rhodobacterales bacterium]